MEGVLLQSRGDTRTKHALTGVAQSLSSIMHAIASKPEVERARREVAEEADAKNAKVEPIAVTRSNIPLNEFTENDSLFLGAFPMLFLLGQKIPSSSSLPDSFAKHLLMQHDQRFGQSHECLLLMFNQQQRHENIRNVTARVKSGNVHIAKFQEIMKEPDIVKRLAAAEKDPDAKESKELLNKILPSLCLGGSKTKFSTPEAKENMSKMLAMVRALRVYDCRESRKC